MASLAEHVAVEQVGDGVFASKRLPERMGNAAPIAYGGYSLATAIHAACLTAPDGFHLYSVLGHYLRPASTDQKLYCVVTESRRSASFATYHISVEQLSQKDGARRCCTQLFADFHREEAPLLTYAAAPTRTYSHWKDCAPTRDNVDAMARRGQLTPAQVATYQKLFGLPANLYELRPCPEGVTTQNVIGILKDAVTSQDHLGPEDKTSADWFRVKHPLPTAPEQMAGLGFFLDGTLSFLPLTHNHMFLDDAAACSSLDFALRIFTPNVNLSNWHLRELKSHCSAYGRTYSESRFWSEDGTLVAGMTQQSILRAPAKRLTTTSKM